MWSVRSTRVIMLSTGLWLVNIVQLPLLHNRLVVKLFDVAELGVVARLGIFVI